MDHPLDNLQIDREIFVDDLVSHARDIPPWNTLVSITELIIELLGRFPDDLEGSLEGKLGPPVRL